MTTAATTMNKKTNTNSTATFRHNKTSKIMKGKLELQTYESGMV